MLQLTQNSITFCSLLVSPQHASEIYFLFHTYFLVIELHRFLCTLHRTLIFFYGATAPSWPGSSHCQGSTITLRHTTLGRTFPDEWSARHSVLYLTTYNTHKRRIHIHASGGIRPLNTSKRAAVDPRLKQRGYWDRRSYTLGDINSYNTKKRRRLLYFKPSAIWRRSFWKILWELEYYITQRRRGISYIQ